MIKKLSIHLAIAMGVLLTATATTTAMAEPTKVEDAVVGAVISEGIKLHGFIDTAPLPLPPGGWTVLSRTDKPDDFGTTKLNFVTLILATTNPEYGIAFAYVRFNPDTANVEYSYSDCSTNDKKIVLNNFGSAPNQLVYRCAAAVNLKNFQPQINYKSSVRKYTQAGGFNLQGYFFDKPEALQQASEITQVFFNAYKSRGRLVAYRFVLTNLGVGSVNFSEGEAHHDSIVSWVQKTGDRLEEFLNRQSVQLPPFQAPR